MLAQNNEVIALDIDEKKIALLNNKGSPILNTEISEFLKRDDLNFTATTSKDVAYKSADFVKLSTPTDYDVDSNYFDTSSVEAVIKDGLLNQQYRLGLRNH